MHQLLGAIHIVLDQPLPVDKLWFWQQERFWVAVGAVTSLLAASATAFMAVFTRALADKTKDLAKETRDVVRASEAESQQREQHHKESLSPNLVMQNFTAVTIVGNDAQGAPVYGIRVQGQLFNLGPGPARKVTVFFRGQGTEPLEIERGPVMPGEPCSVFEAQTLASAFPTPVGRDRFYPFRCAIRYENIFGEIAWLTFESSSGRPEDVLILESVAPTSNMDTFEHSMKRWNLI